MSLFSWGFLRVRVSGIVARDARNRGMSARGEAARFARAGVCARVREVRRGMVRDRGVARDSLVRDAVSA
jgi:hypothetical protein